MKIYTKTGDKGETSLLGGIRVAKDHIRVEVYGTIDELNSYVGLVRDQLKEEKTRKALLKIQNELFVIGTLLATPPEIKQKRKSLKKYVDEISDTQIQFLELEIDAMNEKLPAMTHFILPGGHTTVSYCHITRNVCRRAERLCVTLSKNSEVSEQIIGYLNRLSDYLFVLARKLSKDLQIDEILWKVQ